MSVNYKSYILDFLESMREPDSEVASVISGRSFGEIVSQISENEMDRGIIKLFERAGLDYRRPGSWHTLVGLFGDVFFDEKPGGRRAKWNRPTDRTLRRDFEQCLRRYPKRNGERVCEALKAEFPKKYSDIPATTILRWVGEAGISIKELKRKLKKQPTTAKVRRNAARSLA